MQNFLTVALLAALCLAWKPTRNLGLVCLALLYIAYPNATIGTLLTVGAVYLWRNHK